jgi:broad specificity phosphatase PhoE
MGVLYLVRHGQASFGTDDYDRLSDTGHQQARITGAHLASLGVRPTRVLHGSMLRQQQTAQGILEGLGAVSAPEIPGAIGTAESSLAQWDPSTVTHQSADATAIPTRLDAGWNEYSAWSITGALSDTDPRAAHDSRVFQDELERGIARWAAGDHDADYAETHSTFTTRVDQAFTDARAATGSGETTLVVSSAGSIGWTVARLMGGDFDQWMAFTRVTINTGITKIVTGRGGVSLVSFNEHTHQQPEMVTYR